MFCFIWLVIDGRHREITTVNTRPSLNFCSSSSKAKTKSGLGVATISKVKRNSYTWLNTQTFVPSNEIIKVYLVWYLWCIFLLTSPWAVERQNNFSAGVFLTCPFWMFFSGVFKIFKTKKTSPRCPQSLRGVSLPRPTFSYTKAFVEL